jgi:hypothetical protein
MAGLRFVTHRAIGFARDPEALKVATPVFNLLDAILKSEGEITSKANGPMSDESQASHLSSVNDGKILLLGPLVGAVIQVATPVFNLLDAILKSEGEITEETKEGCVVSPSCHSILMHSGHAK